MSSSEICECIAATRLLIIRKQIEIFKALPGLSATIILESLEKLTDDDDSSSTSSIGSDVVEISTKKIHKETLKEDFCEKLPSPLIIQDSESSTTNSNLVVDSADKNEGVGLIDSVWSESSTTSNDNAIVNFVHDEEEGVGISSSSSARSDVGLEMNGVGRRAYDKFIEEEKDDKGRTWFRCLKCQKHLTMKANVRLHLWRVHYKHRFKCSNDKCFKKFYTTTELKSHKQTCHGSSSSSKPPSSNRGHKWTIPDGGQKKRVSDVLVKVKGGAGHRQPWRCKLCQKTFTYKSRASVHVQRVHWRVQVLCPRCERPFYNNQLLNRHKMKCMTMNNNDYDQPDNEAELNANNKDEGPNSIVVSNPFPNFNLEQSMKVKVVVEPLILIDGDDDDVFGYSMDTLEADDEEEDDLGIRIVNVVGSGGETGSISVTNRTSPMKQ